MFEVLYTGRNITRIKLHCFHLDQVKACVHGNFVKQGFMTRQDWLTLHDQN